jgi:hypothetical protein
MAWHRVTSSGSGRRNDDLARVFEHGQDGVIDVLLLDGATSLAGRDHVDAVEGDPAWFVRRFADAFGAVVASAPLEGEVQAACVERALARVREAWEAATEGSAVPLYAWPIAALSWVRIRPDGAGGATFESWCLGDCKLLLREAGGAVHDLDPYDNAYEHHLQQSVAGMVAEGVLDAAQRFAALTPMLRARREEQMGTQTPEVLCLAPRGPFAARRGVLRLDAGAAAGAQLLAMSDGYYRLVDPYALYDDAGLARACAGAGPDSLLAELRRFEAARDTAQTSVKGMDDATAIVVTLGGAGRAQAHGEEEEALVARYIAAYNAFDVEAMLATLHPEVRFENHAGGRLTVATDGIDAFRTLAQQGATMFAERAQRVTGSEHVDGMLLATIAWRGRPAHDIPGGPAAGTLLELSGRSEFAFAAGRIVKIVDRS